MSIKQDNKWYAMYHDMTRQSLDEGNYKNMARVMQYLRGTQELMLTIEPGEHPSWWVDRSYAIHTVMKSHRGTFMTLGKGAT